MLNKAVGPGILIWLFLISLVWAEVPVDRPGVKNLEERVMANPGDLTARLELAGIFYEQAGFRSYFEAKSLLWTENSVKVSDLSKKVPLPAMNLGAECQKQLLQVLQVDPGNWEALTMAGDYHFFCQQKETALWYYRRAVKIAPFSLEANLALADFYLSQWQPEAALQLLKEFDEPLSAFRKGEAFFQLGEYHFALAYLLKAHPLPYGLQISRDKDLVKSYLAVDDRKQAERYIKDEYFQILIPGILFRELQGWLAWRNGDRQDALNNWQLGQYLDRDYRSWESDLLGLEQRETPAKNFPNSLSDPNLNSNVKIFSGEAYLREGNPDLAYQSFLEAIKRDQRSLLGYIAAGNILLKQKKHLQALQLFKNGLSINPNFSPLIERKIEAERKLGQLSTLAEDLDTLTKSFRLMKGASRLNGVLTKDESGHVFLAISGITRDLTGLWVSFDGLSWEWYLWWGVPLALKKGIRHLWVVPIGVSLSGEAFYVDVSPEPASQIDVSREQNGEVSLKLSMKAKLIVETVDENDNRDSYVSDQLSEIHLIPGGVFNNQVQKARVWLQTEDGGWGKVQFNLGLSGPKVEQPLNCQILYDSLSTNRRQVAFHFKVSGGSGMGLKMSVGEAGQKDDWIPFQEFYAYQLSSGDGFKTVTANFIDQDGNQGTAQLNIELDTVSPGIMNLENKNIDPNALRLSWTASEPVTSWLRILSRQGVWSDIPVTADLIGRFTGIVSVKTSIFCKIVLKDQAGNWGIYSNDAINTWFAEMAEFHFTVNGGWKYTNVRTIEVKPENLNYDLEWKISSDLVTWSPRQRGNQPCKWRLNSRDGEQLIFIKCDPDGNPGQTRLQVVPVYLDTLPPRIKEITPLVTGERVSVTVLYEEPVKLQVNFGKEGEPLGEDPSNSSDYKNNYFVDLKTITNRDKCRIELEATDQAGNIGKNSFWLEGSALSPAD